MKVEGKVAVVLGGARGIGRACMEMLLKQGAKVSYIYNYYQCAFKYLSHWSTR
jgi:NAD(P)-dependent dehydrogenase (short-subunit alcohol dehydrogenase family)